MRTFLKLFTLTVVLTACVDTTGLSATSSKIPHPKSNPKATVLLEEFGDLECPACKVVHTIVTPYVLAKVGNDVRFEFKHYPLRMIHPDAEEAAEASECAADQGKFWEFIDLAYEHQADLSSSALREWGATLKLDSTLFDRCIRSKIKRAVTDSETKIGESRDLQGTPTFYVNGQKVPTGTGSIIEAVLKAKSSAAKL